MTNPRVVIVGGGTAGMSVLNSLKRKLPKARLSLIEPSLVHTYQPLWTLVGGGVFPVERSEQPMQSLIPAGVDWYQQKVAGFLPESNQVRLANGQCLEYDYLVVALGIQLDWHQIKGLKETLGKNKVTSNYSRDSVSYTWQCIDELQSGPAIFTFPHTPVKCAGAPQKIMYLAEETFRERQLRSAVPVHFISAGASIFGVAKYRNALEAIVAEREIQTEFKWKLVEVNGPARLCYFEHMETGQVRELSYGMLHVTPPMSAPDVIKSSPLANAQGWVEVDKDTLQHVRFQNVFSLGDCSSTPNSKTGAAVRSQGPVLINNLISHMRGKNLKEKYDGYASCPLITGRGKCILAEFNYQGEPTETFPFDQSQERLSMYWLKKYVIPFMYWNFMLKGYF